MTRVYLDTNVLVYAIGGDAAQRAPSREILRAVADGRLNAETSAYTLQEFVRQRTRRGDATATQRARDIAEVFAALHPVDLKIVRSALDLVERHPGFDISDAVHVATAQAHGVTTLLSADRGLDRIPGVERVDPLDRDRLAGLIDG